MAHSADPRDRSEALSKVTIRPAKEFRVPADNAWLLTCLTKLQAVRAAGQDVHACCIQAADESEPPRCIVAMRFLRTSPGSRGEKKILWGLLCSIVLSPSTNTGH